MDHRISEVEQMITDCNNHALAQKQSSLKSLEDWKALMGTIQEIQKTAEKVRSEGKEKEGSLSKADPVCSKCGTQLKTGAKFCKNCGSKVDFSSMISQPAQGRLCTCGAIIVEGAKFCRECGKPVR